MNTLDDILVLSESIDDVNQKMKDLIDLVWLFVVVIMIFNMQMGFILLEVGVSRKKHSRNVLLKNIIDTLVCTLGFWLLGYSLSINAQGGFMGSGLAFNQEHEKNYYIKWLINFSFCNTSSTIVSGCVAERMHNDTYLVYSLLICCFIYPVVASWVWGGGWLMELEYQDYAGSSVVHMIGGFAGLIQTLMLGPRLGFSSKFNNSKFNYGRDMIALELRKLEMLYTKREERLKTYQNLWKQANKEDEIPQYD